MDQDYAHGLIPLYRAGDQIEFLLIQHIEGHWAFPKGHAEGNESPLAAAQREFEEETGIMNYQVDDEVTFSEEYYPQQNGQILHKIVTYYPAWISDQYVTIQAEELQDYAWLEYRPAQGKMTFPSGKKILRQVKKYIHQQLQK